MRLKLACPACGVSGNCTIRGELESWTGPDGQATGMVAGSCDRCASAVLFAPTPEAVERIRMTSAAARETA